MTDTHPAGFTPRPFPIPVVEASPYPAAKSGLTLEDGPCPLNQHQQACEKLFPFYRRAAQDVRNWRREAYDAGQKRQQAGNPLSWLMQAGNQLYARAEQHFAQKRLEVMAGQIDNELVNRHLGWPAHTTRPVCEMQPAAHRTPTRVLTAFATVAALVITPLKPEWMPSTPNERLEAALAFGALCGSDGKYPDKSSLCHAPKVTLRPRKGELTLDNTLA